MSSGDLVPQSNFSQTGQVDWVQLNRGVVQFTYEALARMNYYRVDAFTMVTALHIDGRMQLSTEGEKRMIEALDGLKFYSSLDRFLYFGFGLKSVPRMLRDSHTGLSILAISAALSECVHVEFAAEVLNKIVVHLNVEEASRPTLPSWVNLAKACAGTLAKTDFATLVENFTALHGSETSIFTATPRSHLRFNDSWRSCSSDDTIAEALVELADVSRKEGSSITIEGGADAGFLAAVAEWLFSMSIVITDANGTVLYPPGGTISSSFQARFIYTDRYSELPRTRDMELLRLKSKIIRLKDVSDVLYTNNMDKRLLGNGRVPWENWLEKTFQSTFRTLISENVRLNFGWALGYAARIFDAVAKAEAGVDFDTRKHWIYYTAEGSGYGYVHSLVDRFPELKAVEQYIGNAAGSGFKEALQGYGSSIAKIAEVCGCADCNVGGDNQRMHCLVIVIETILQAGLILSNTSVEEGLRPRISGLQRLYERQFVPRYLSLRDNNSARKQDSLGPITRVIEPELESEKLHTEDQRVRLMIDGALGMFALFTELPSDTAICAWSIGGICAYRKILEDFSMCDHNGYRAGQVRIVAGQIEWRNRIYDRIQDSIDHPSEEFRTEDLLISPEELRGFNSPSLFLEESTQDTISMLSAAIRLRNSNGRMLTVPPAYVGNWALMARGLVQCRHPPGALGEQEERNAPEYEIKMRHNTEIALYRAPNDRSVYAALVIANMQEPEYYVVYGGNCINCALRTLVTEVEPLAIKAGRTRKQAPRLLLITSRT